MSPAAAGPATATAGAPPPTIDGAAVTPVQVGELLRRLSGLPGQPVRGRHRATTIACTDRATGRLRAVTTAGELAAAVRSGSGLAPPPAVGRYRPTPAQRRFVTTRDETCRFPGCRRPARDTDVDHVVPHAEGGPTDVANLSCLCRRHHRLKTHAPGWAFRLGPDGTLHVTTPSGVTRTTRPPGLHDPGDDPPPF